MFGIQMVTIFVTKVWPEVLAIWTLIYVTDETVVNVQSRD